MFSTLLEIVLKENELEKFLFKTSTFLERGYYLKKGANYSQSYTSLFFWYIQAFFRLCCYDGVFGVQYFNESKSNF